MLKMSQADYDLIRQEAEQSYPRESCGILLGISSDGCRNVNSIIQCDNADPEPLRRYTIDPKQVIAAFKLARSRNQDIIGFYHSHPDHPAQFSDTDLAEAYWQDCSYVITSVNHGRAAQTKSFVLTGWDESRNFVEERIEVLSKL
jgi:proteasome lid subunit RPN8/RPN11